MFTFQSYLNKSSYALYLKKNGGFALWKTPLLPLDPQTFVSFPSEVIQASTPPINNVQDLLSQEFTFLGRGVQSYAFLGEDGETVLKIFKNYRYETHEFLLSFPLPSSIKKKIQKKIDRRNFRKDRFYQSCFLAAYEIPSLTQVTYLHAFPTKDLFLTLRLKDRMGTCHLVKTDKVQFLLQKKLSLGNTLAKEAIENNDKAAFFSLLEATETMMEERFKKGIIDRDFAFHKNVGFLEGKAIQLDFGSMIKIDPHNPQSTSKLLSLKRQELSHLESLLKKRYPAASLWIDDYFKTNPVHQKLFSSLQD